MISFSFRPLYHLGKSRRYPLDKPQGRSGRSGTAQTWNENSVAQRVPATLLSNLFFHIPFDNIKIFQSILINQIM
jgi:hypothetical protein